MREVNIYIGAYVNFLRIGAYGAVIEDNGKTRELSRCYHSTTEYRIRLSGVTAALNTLTESCEVTLYTDSEYVVNGINKGWAKSWSRNNWRISDGKEAKNADLWAKLLNLTEKHNIDFVWIRCRNGFEYGNEYFKRCDELAIDSVRRG